MARIRETYFKHKLYDIIDIYVFFSFLNSSTYVNRLYKCCIVKINKIKARFSF